jgi:hypothetical protein
LIGEGNVGKESRRATGLVLLVAGLLTMMGCAAPDDPYTDEVNGALVQRSERQVQALQDGTVDSDEYEAGFRAFASCLEAEGFELLVEDDPGTALIEYSVPSLAVETGVEFECYETHYALLDMNWQMQNERPGE